MELWLYKSRTSNECVLCFRHWDQFFLGVSGNYAGQAQPSRTRDVAKQKAFYSLAEFIYQNMSDVSVRLSLIEEVLEVLRSGVYAETEVDEFTDVMSLDQLRSGLECNTNRFRTVNSNDVTRTPRLTHISWHEDPRSFSQIVTVSVTPMVGDATVLQLSLNFFELQSRPELYLTTVARNIAQWILHTAAQANSYLTFRVWVREITTQLLGSIHSQGGRS